jgi:hypothetical protein
VTRPRHRRVRRVWFPKTLLTFVGLAAGLLATLAALGVPGALTPKASLPGSGTPPLASTLSRGSSGTLAPSAYNSTPIPVYAYFYQWFQASSWDRAKQDLPLAGRYSSDDAHVLRDQVQQAKTAGIGGFLTSWKSTDTLNRRLDLLVQIAHSENLDLGVVYEALDFHRHPLPAATVQHDLVYLVGRWGSSLTSRYYGRPVIIWTGTDQYTTAEVHAVKAALGNRAYLLAASRSVAGYERVAETVDGEAYYWSSADPSSAATSAKLNAFSQAVHTHHGLWFAPAASGYDGRSLGGTRVIGRDNGQTLVKSLDNAFASSPNAVAVISWNEWSENTYIEPGKKYGDRELQALKAYRPASGQSIPTPLTGADSSQGDSSSGWTGARAALTLSGLTIVMVLALLLRPLRSRRRRQRGTGRHVAPRDQLNATKHKAPTELGQENVNNSDFDRIR